MASSRAGVETELRTGPRDGAGGIIIEILGNKKQPAKQHEKEQPVGEMTQERAVP